MGAELDFCDSRLPADLAALSRDELVDLGRRVVAFGQWALGDLAGAVQTAYGEGDLARYADEIGVSYATLRDCRRVSAAFPAEYVERSANSWSVYRVLASRRDGVQLVSREKPWTVAEARALVAPKPKPPQQIAGKPAAPQKPPEQVAKTADTETVTAITEPGGGGQDTSQQQEREKHVCRFACRCGKTDTAFSEQAGQLMDELEEARKAACGHDAAWHAQAEWLHARAVAQGWAWDGRQFAKPPPAVAGKHAGHRVTANGKNSRAHCETCREWFSTAAAS